MDYKDEVIYPSGKDRKLVIDNDDDFFACIHKIRDSLPSQESLELINCFNETAFSFELEYRNEYLKDLCHDIIEMWDVLCCTNSSVVISFFKKVSKYLPFHTKTLETDAFTHMVEYFLNNGEELSVIKTLYYLYMNESLIIDRIIILLPFLLLLDVTSEKMSMHAFYFVCLFIQESSMDLKQYYNTVYKLVTSYVKKIDELKYKTVFIRGLSVLMKNEYFIINLAPDYIVELIEFGINQQHSCFFSEALNIFKNVIIAYKRHELTTKMESLLSYFDLENLCSYIELAQSSTDLLTNLEGFIKICFENNSDINNYETQETKSQFIYSLYLMLLDGDAIKKQISIDLFAIVIDLFIPLDISFMGTDFFDILSCCIELNENCKDNIIIILYKLLKIFQEIEQEEEFKLYINESFLSSIEEQIGCSNSDTNKLLILHL